MLNLTSNEWVAIGILLFVLIIVALTLWGVYGVNKLEKALKNWEPPERD